jgi:hypothetical protein
MSERNAAADQPLLRDGKEVGKLNSVSPLVSEQSRLALATMRRGSFAVGSEFRPVERDRSINVEDALLFKLGDRDGNQRLRTAEPLRDRVGPHRGRVVCPPEPGVQKNPSAARYVGLHPAELTHLDFSEHLPQERRKAIAGIPVNRNRMRRAPSRWQGKADAVADRGIARFIV